MKSIYRIEHSEDGNEVCIIPNPSIATDIFCFLSESFTAIGYKYWLPADYRCGYLLCKDHDLYYKKHLLEACYGSKEVVSLVNKSTE